MKAAWRGPWVIRSALSKVATVLAWASAVLSAASEVIRWLA
jgi:hypothetical protein